MRTRCRSKALLLPASGALEMAEGAAFERDLRAVLADEARRRRALKGLTDPGDRDPGLGRRRFKCGGVRRPHRGEDFIVVAAGRGNLKKSGIARDEMMRRRRQRQPPQLYPRRAATDP